jgi:hypothetical protein
MTTCGECSHFEKDHESSLESFRTNWKGYCHLFNQNTYRNDGNNCHGFEGLNKTRCKIPIEDAIEDFEAWFRSCAWEKTDKDHFDIGMAVIKTAKNAINQNYQLREALKEIHEHRLLPDLTKPTVESLWDYLNYQFPETRGNIPLKKFCQKLSEMNCEPPLTNKIRCDLHDEIEGYLDGAPDASEASKLANRIFRIIS